MFAKLLKHEWKASCRMQTILCLAVLGMGVLSGLLLRFVSSYQVSGPIIEIALMMMLVAILFFCISLGIYVFGAELLLLYRFYKNKFTDEGYLTFTLPANSHQLFLSSFLNIVAWKLIAALTVAVAASVLLMLGSAKDGLFNSLIFRDLLLDLQQDWSFFVEDIVSGRLLFRQVLLPLVTNSIIAMTCITAGAVLVKKHKLLAALGIYYGISFVKSLINSAITFTVLVAADTTGQDLPWLTEILEASVQLLLAVGGYFLSVYLMRNKLNLP